MISFLCRKENLHCRHQGKGPKEIHHIISKQPVSGILQRNIFHRVLLKRLQMIHFVYLFYEPHLRAKQYIKYHSQNDWQKDKANERTRFSIHFLSPFRIRLVFLDHYSIVLFAMLPPPRWNLRLRSSNPAFRLVVAPPFYFFSKKHSHQLCYPVSH